MRRIIILGSFMMGVCALAMAQKGLYVHSIFSGKYNQEKNAVVTILKGKDLKEYGLSYFHSITVAESKSDVSFFEYGVLADSENAVKIEMVKQKGALLACYFQLPPHKDDAQKLNRFVLFRKLSNESATIIYMEGSTNLKSLIKLFVTKK